MILNSFGVSLYFRSTLRKALFIGAEGKQNRFFAFSEFHLQFSRIQTKNNTGEHLRMFSFRMGCNILIFCFLLHLVICDKKRGCSVSINLLLYESYKIWFRALAFWRCQPIENRVIRAGLISFRFKLNHLGMYTLLNAIWYFNDLNF